MSALRPWMQIFLVEPQDDWKHPIPIFKPSVPGEAEHLKFLVHPFGSRIHLNREVQKWRGDAKGYLQWANF